MSLSSVSNVKTNRFLPWRTAGAVILAHFALATGSGLHAHGDDQVLIQALTEEIARAPEADLYIRRGELYRHHQEWNLAEADFVAAARLQPGLAVVDYFRARTLLEAGAAEKARPFIERYVAKVPAEAEGWFLRGEIQAAGGDLAAGAADYATGIRHAPHPRPEHFIQRARLLAAATAGGPADALAALDAGIARLGPVISLVDYAIALEIERKDFEAALARIAVAMEHSPRRETWLVRRGDMLVKAGRPQEATEAYQAALGAIDELPPRYRDTVPIEKLARDARIALARLKSDLNPARPTTDQQP